jgi:hypothetical protein
LGGADLAVFFRFLDGRTSSSESSATIKSSISDKVSGWEANIDKSQKQTIVFWKIGICLEFVFALNDGSASLPRPIGLKDRLIVILSLAIRLDVIDLLFGLVARKYMHLVK